MRHAADHTATAARAAARGHGVRRLGTLTAGLAAAAVAGTAGFTVAAAAGTFADASAQRTTATPASTDDGQQQSQAPAVPTAPQQAAPQQAAPRQAVPQPAVPQPQQQVPRTYTPPRTTTRAPVVASHSS